MAERAHSERGSRPLVSAIMIFRDAERFMAEAIESVLRQTCRDWELILVDDGSHDSSTRIAHDYAHRHPRQIRYLEHAGHAWRGMSASRNLGVRAARGQFIGFIDSDDIWEPGALEYLVTALTAEPTALLVYTPALWWYSWTGDVSDTVRDVSDLKPDVAVNAPGLREGSQLLSAILADGGLVPCMCGVLVRAAALAGGDWFDDGFRNLYEDQVFLARLALSGKLLLSHHVVSRYRHHKDSACARLEQHGGNTAARLVFLDWLDRRFSQHGIHSGQLRDRLNAELEWHSAALHFAEAS